MKRSNERIMCRKNSVNFILLLQTVLYLFKRYDDEYNLIRKALSITDITPSKDIFSQKNYTQLSTRLG